MALRTSRSEKLPITITITNQKGGTGKTTLTALMAYGLALKGYNVLVLDLDPQAHLSSLFLKINEIERVNDGSIHMAQGQPFHIKRVALDSNVKIGLIPSGLNYIITIFRGQIPSHDPHAIRLRILREPAITRDYDYVICDTPPELFPPTLWGLYAADYVIIPTNLEELSLAGVKLLLKDVIPEVVMRNVKQPKVLGVMLINVVRRFTATTFNRIGAALCSFIDRLPAPIKELVFNKPLFDSVIHRYNELKDLMYRPRRWELPISRVLKRNSSLKKEVESTVNEVLNRINNFKGAGP